MARREFNPGLMFEWTGDPADRLGPGEFTAAGVLDNPGLTALRDGEMRRLGMKVVKDALLVIFPPADPRQIPGRPAHLHDIRNRLMEAGNPTGSTARMAIPLVGIRPTLHGRKLLEAGTLHHAAQERILREARSREDQEARGLLRNEQERHERAVLEIVERHVRGG